jgi:hypothetical protein
MDQPSTTPAPPPDRQWGCLLSDGFGLGIPAADRDLHQRLVQRELRHQRQPSGERAHMRLAAIVIGSVIAAPVNNTDAVAGFADSVNRASGLRPGFLQRPRGQRLVSV